MTKTIELARAAGMEIVDDKFSIKPFLERFAELVRADERASPCDQCVHKGDVYDGGLCLLCRHFYRSRFQSKG